MTRIREEEDDQWRRLLLVLHITTSCNIWGLLQALIYLHCNGFVYSVSVFNIQLFSEAKQKVVLGQLTVLKFLYSVQFYRNRDSSFYIFDYVLGNVTWPVVIYIDTLLVRHPAGVRQLHNVKPHGAKTCCGFSFGLKTVAAVVVWCWHVAAVMRCEWLRVSRLDLFHALTLGGKELELFEEETGAWPNCWLLGLYSVLVIVIFINVLVVRLQALCRPREL